MEGYEAAGKMATSRSVSGKGNTFTSNTSKVLNEDVFFSAQHDFDTTAISPPLRPSHGI